MSDPESGLPDAAAALRGPDAGPLVRLCVPVQPVYLSLIGAVVKWFGRQAGLSDKACCELEVAVDEGCTNVMVHAFPDGVAAELCVGCSALDDGVKVTIADKGRRFDMEEGIKDAKQKREHDPASGGMGLHLMHCLTDDVRHEWDERNGNRLALFKRRKGC